MVVVVTPDRNTEPFLSLMDMYFRHIAAGAPVVDRNGQVLAINTHNMVKWLWLNGTALRGKPISEL